MSLNDDLSGNPLRVADSFLFKWSGSDVAGSRTTNDYDTFVEELGVLFGGTKISNGTMTGYFNQTQTSLHGDDLDIVRIGGSGVGGNKRWQFDTQEKAENFKHFFDDIVDML